MAIGTGDNANAMRDVYNRVCYRHNNLLPFLYRRFGSVTACAKNRAAFFFLFLLSPSFFPSLRLHAVSPLSPSLGAARALAQSLSSSASDDFISVSIKECE